MDSDQDTARAVGCPIRRSRDQRSLASPPGFSQRATSFIASQCQGIHQMPLLALERHTQRQGPFRYQKTDIRDQNHLVRQTLLSEDTAGHTAQPFGRTRVSRYGHTTRFFTIVHQHMPMRPHRGCSQTAISGFFSPRRNRPRPASDI